MVEEKYLLYSECTVAIDFNSNTVRRYDMGGVHPQENAIPQPHISNYGCFGQHSTILGRLITESDFIGIIEQVIEAASGLNWSDGTVVRSMIQGFNTRYAEVKCFETLDTHERFSFDDFIDKKMEHYILKDNDLVISCKGKTFKTAVVEIPLNWHQFYNYDYADKLRQEK